MWKTPEQLGLNKDQINDIVEKLWSERHEGGKTCPDCGVFPNETHLDGCDVPHCPICGIQALQCEHEEEIIWEGLWPNTRECYENKWITFWQGNNSIDFLGKSCWSFDYNRAAIEEQEKINKGYNK